MKLPDKCPFCGAGVFTNFCGQNGWKETWVAYECHTWVFADRDRANNQSNLCISRERARLADRASELEAQNAQLQSELDYAKGRAKELEAETLRLEDLAKHRGKLMEQAVDQSRDLEARVAEMEARCKRLEEAGDVLQSAVVGVEGMTHWQWLAAAHEADLKWRSAKEARP